MYRNPFYCFAYNALISGAGYAAYGCIFYCVRFSQKLNRIIASPLSHSPVNWKPRFSLYHRNEYSAWHQRQRKRQCSHLHDCMRWLAAY
jgi:hypothetical protein